MADAHGHAFLYFQKGLLPRSPTVTGFRVSQAQSGSQFCAIHQSFTRTSGVLHQSCAVGFTSRAVTLKESRGRFPQPSSRASHVYQVTLHLHPFPNARTWLTRPRKNTVGRAATSGGRSNRGIGQSHQLCAQPLGTLDCLMRIHHHD